MIKEALQYLKRASIMPVGKDKKPLLSSWKEFQTRKPTEEEVKKWWKIYPNANIGIITGKISNIAVIDVEKEGKLDGLPETVTAKTGNGGWHLYYQYIPGVENKSRVRPFIDIRGEGGFVVAPPSITEYEKNGKKSGGKYEWIKKIAIQPFPKHLFGIKEKLDWTDVAKGATEGQRNETAAKYIGKLMSIFDPDTWENTVWKTALIWNANNNPPLGERELRVTYESIKKKAIQNERPHFINENEIKIVHISETEDLFISDQKYECKIKMIDETIGGGFEEGDLIVVSAPTGMGKTTLMQTITKNFSSQMISNLWFSYEVLMKNIWKTFQDMGMTKNDVVFAPFKNESGSLEFIQKAVKKSMDIAPVKIVYIDHLGYLVPNLSKNNIGQNYSAYLQQVCKELKTLAIDNRIIIILAAHMRKTDNPKIEDIRDSSGVAQEADVVVMLNREIINTESDYYGDKTQITIVKNRKTGMTKRAWFRLVNRQFMEVDKGENLILQAKKIFKAKEVSDLGIKY